MDSKFKAASSLIGGHIIGHELIINTLLARSFSAVLSGNNYGDSFKNYLLFLRQN